MSSLPSLVRLAILDSYGVEWPLATFARDVLQNFFDTTLSFRDIVLDRDDAARTLEIRGPAEFDLELLAYVGATTKLDGKTAGGFGEGFKICALVGVRDHGLAIRAGSGETEIEVAFEPVQLGRELCYRVHGAPGRKGSFVRLEGCTDAVFAAFETARDQFYDLDNPHLGPLVIADPDGTVAVHLAAEGEKHGEIYYRRQLRGEIAYGTSGRRNVPVARLTFACHRSVDYLEGDRDRRTLEPESVARAVGERLPPEALLQTFLLLQSEWHQWHEVVAGLLRAAIERKLRFDWPGDWVAQSADGRDHAHASAAERIGYKLAIPAFRELGMQTPKDVVKLGDPDLRPPSAGERERIDVAIALYATLSDDDPPSTAWQIVDSKQAKPSHSHHNGRELSIAERLLGADAFALGTGTMLHELAHELGDESSPAFLHRLSRMVGAAIRNPSAVAAARARFEQERPKGRRVAEVPEVEPYTPPHDKRPAGARGHSFYVNVYVPPGFPPTTALVARLHEGAAAADLGCYAAVTEVWSTAEAAYHKVTGLPCVKFSSETDLDPGGASRRPGLRLRTYGPARDVLPSVEMVADGFRAYLDEIRARPLSVETPEQKLSYRDMYARLKCADWIKATAKGTWREHLKIGLTHAVSLRFAALKSGIEQTQDELFAAVRDDVSRILQAADAHLAAQTDFDPGDAFEETALHVAHTVFMAGFAADGASRAARDFAVIREASKELLAVDLGADMRESVLAWCVARTGPKDTYLYDRALPTLDEAAFRAAFTPALPEARRVQHILDHDERGLRWNELERRLESAVQTPEEREKARAARIAQSAASALFMRHRRMRAALTHTIKATWERTLAETGSAAAAGEACIALLRRLENEVAADERRAEAKTGAA